MLKAQILYPNRSTSSVIPRTLLAVVDFIKGFRFFYLLVSKEIFHHLLARRVINGFFTIVGNELPFVGNAVFLLPIKVIPVLGKEIFILFEQIVTCFFIQQFSKEHFTIKGAF